MITHLKPQTTKQVCRINALQLIEKLSYSSSLLSCSMLAIIVNNAHLL